MSETATIRHDLVFKSSAFNPSPVFIAGVGAGGSWLCLYLAKLGVRNITICDPQTVAIENVGPSIYGRKHVGMKKVEACAQIVHDLSDNIVLRTRECLFESVGELSGVVFLCVDSFDLRKKILLEQCVPQQSIDRVFEGRMSAHYFLCHSISTSSKEEVGEWLRYTPSDAEALPALPGCGATPISVGPTASAVASFMASQFIQWFEWSRCEGAELVNQVRVDLSTYEMESYVW